MIGPGKYDKETTAIREAHGALGVVVMVIGGDKGEGFSCQGTDKVLAALPSLLRSVADQIEGDLQPAENERERPN